MFHKSRILVARCLDLLCVWCGHSELHKQLYTLGLPFLEDLLYRLVTGLKDSYSRLERTEMKPGCYYFQCIENIYNLLCRKWIIWALNFSTNLANLKVCDGEVWLEGSRWLGDDGRLIFTKLVYFILPWEAIWLCLLLLAKIRSMSLYPLISSLVLSLWDPVRFDWMWGDSED